MNTATDNSTPRPPRHPELLAPVRNRITLGAAITAGADAVYLGLGELNMRANSPGITLADLADVVAFAHDKNVRVYITLNSLIFDDDLPRLDELLSAIADAHADAIIAWDFAVIQRAKKFNLPIHLSTQASVANVEAAAFFADLGIRRIVLARELSLEQIRAIKRQRPTLEIEAFVHGAMCVSISGRCLMSQFQMHRSANRGDCLQPCRRTYRITDLQNGMELDIDNSAVLSPKDLCTLPILDELIDAGIDVFKIEGRSRPPEYIAAVVTAYRRAIDAVHANEFTPELVATLMDRINTVYNRGFSTGFYLGRPGPQDWSATTGNACAKRKEFIGRVTDYDPIKRRCSFRVQASPVAQGDHVQIHGPTTGVVELTVTNLRHSDLGPAPSLPQTAPGSFDCDRPVAPADHIYRFVTND